MPNFFEPKQYFAYASSKLCEFSLHDCEESLGLFQTICHIFKFHCIVESLPPNKLPIVSQFHSASGKFSPLNNIWCGTFPTQVATFGIWQLFLVAFFLPTIFLIRGQGFRKANKGWYPWSRCTRSRSTWRARAATSQLSTQTQIR